MAQATLECQRVTARLGLNGRQALVLQVSSKLVRAVLHSFNVRPVAFLAKF